jgi:hypothetical protein
VCAASSHLVAFDFHYFCLAGPGATADGIVEKIAKHGRHVHRHAPIGRYPGVLAERRVTPDSRADVAFAASLKERIAEASMPEPADPSGPDPNSPYYCAASRRKAEGR